MESLKRLMLELDQIFGVSGDEGRVAAYIKEELSGKADDFFEDPLGGQYYIKKGSNPDLKVMLAAHMDEIGFIVTHIDEKGFVYFGPVGFHDSRMVIDQVLTIDTFKGFVNGVTGSKPAHIVSAEEEKKAIPIEKLHLDVGTDSYNETLELGVRVGDYITFDRKGQYLNNGKFFTGKAVDNRAGCAVMVEVMKRLANKQIVPTVYGVATAQEEVGIRGAGPAGFIVQPDIALAIDVTLAGGTPGIEDKDLRVQLGKGTAIVIYDGGLAVPKKLSKKLIEVAEKENIPYQREVLLKGATDGKAISLSGKGVVTGGVSIPSRYIHSAVGMIHLDDLENSVQLIVSFIENLTDKL
ncbi:M42 family metallopeptidase [Neobacillus niacini]|uniref:M42 family metallopeptidase n=1 Tax=Neobacillus niacini TaxID=86668 RepID=UPI0021CB7231|nr:M42 family metallopeptidase [Neobacillus niacini]MCM3764656.1 M42 family metallopeptidase [Neobacillus niacini]